VFIPYHSYLAVLAGKNSYIHEVPLRELAGRYGKDIAEDGDRLYDELRKAMKEGRFSVVIIDSEPSAQLQDILNERYVRKGSVFTSKTVFRQFTGVKSRPEFVYTLKGHKAGDLF
jgi:hypothetical protein